MRPVLGRDLPADGCELALRLVEIGERGVAFGDMRIGIDDWHP